MTEAKENEQAAMHFDGAAERTPEKSAADVANSIAKMHGSLKAIAANVGKINQDVQVLSARFGANHEPGVRVSKGEGESLGELREAIASVRAAAENMPLEVSRAVVAELSAAVASLNMGTDVKLQGLGDTAKTLYDSAVAIERDILEARAIHEAHLEVRERWALIVMLISLWFSVVIFLSFGYLWFR
jgi:hypothetical protein